MPRQAEGQWYDDPWQESSWDDWSWDYSEESYAAKERKARRAKEKVSMEKMESQAPRAEQRNLPMLPRAVRRLLPQQTSSLTTRTTTEVENLYVVFED